MRRQDKERRKKRIQMTAELAATLCPDCPLEKRVKLVQDLYPVTLEMERQVNELVLKSLSSVRFVYRPRLPR